MKCSGCHTYGKGEKVGPDLKGVADRCSRNLAGGVDSFVRAGDQEPVIGSR
jgi:cytochrome c2